MICATHKYGSKIKINKKVFREVAGTNKLIQVDSIRQFFKKNFPFGFIQVDFPNIYRGKM